MADESLYIEVDDTEGHAIAGVLDVDDEEWARGRAAGGSGSAIVLRPTDEGDEDVEGHAAGATVRLRAFDDEADTEGHAMSLHFPSAEAADAFRRRLLLAGVLTGTIALGAAAGAGLGSVSQAPAEAGAAAGAAAGMDWSQPERQNLEAAAGAGSAGGMDWTQSERQNVGAAAGAGSAAGMDWTQSERQQPAAAEDAPVVPDPRHQGPTPE